MIKCYAGERGLFRGLIGLFIAMGAFNPGGISPMQATFAHNASTGGNYLRFLNNIPGEGAFPINFVFWGFVLGSAYYRCPLKVRAATVAALLASALVFSFIVTRVFPAPTGN
jgi:hypothetical protein